jgi:hypothetical protein
MIMKVFKNTLLAALISAAMLPGVTEASLSATYNWRCPWNQYGGSWYLLFNSVGPGSAYIQFTNDSNVPSQKEWKGSCLEYAKYVSEIKNGKSILSYGYNGYGKFHDGKVFWYYSALGRSKAHFHIKNGGYFDRNVEMPPPAHERFELKILGDTFVYNEAGEIYHRELGLVAEFSCNPPPPDAACMIGKRPNGQSFW